MTDIIGYKVQSIHYSPLKKEIVIFLVNTKQCIILKDIATCYDTGIIGQEIIKIDFNADIGVSFHEEIIKSELVTKDYSFFQMLTKTGAFEAALKTFDIRATSESIM